MSSANNLIKFDTTDPALRFHDLELFDEVQGAGGISWTESAGGMWVVADFDLIQQVAGDERFKSGEGVRFPSSGAPRVLGLEYDRPVHTEHRKILTGAVGQRAVKSLEPMVRDHARKLIRTLVGSDVVDLGEKYAFPMPLDVIFSIVGAPDDIKERANELAESIFLYRTPMKDGSDAAEGIRVLLDGLIADKMAVPGDDWLSGLINNRGPGGNNLSDEEVRGAILALLTGGHHSTSRGIACLLVEILKDPDLQQTLRKAPERIPAIVEESLRLNTPLRWFARTASEDVQIGSETISAGDRVYMLYAAGNRDPKRFTNPQELDPDGRKNQEHLAFGWGMHRCVGMPLAQLEMRIAIEELFAATTDVRLAGEITWTSNVEPRHIPVNLL